MVSVVIPALNEAAGIAQTIAAVKAEAHRAEVVVVDGGSTDATFERACSSGAHVLRAGRGRARQMNAGARAASGDVLLFLHADTLLPPGALAAVKNALGDPRTEAGAFRLRFDVETPLLRFYSYCTRMPWPLICFGDRALFVRRSTFDAVGGFPEIPIFEDLEMARRLHRRGGFRFLDAAVTTSARRFLAQGPLRQQMLNARLWLQYVAGADPHRLARHYRYAGSQPQP